MIANRLVYELDSKFAKYKYPEVIARNLSNGVSYTYILPKNATNADEWSTLAQKIRKQLASLNRPVIGANGRGEFGVLFETEEYCALAASGVAVYILDNEEYPRGHLTFQYLPDYEENVMLDDGCSSGLHTGVDISAPIIQFVTSRSKKISKEVFG